MIDDMHHNSSPLPATLASRSSSFPIIVFSIQVPAAMPLRVIVRALHYDAYDVIEPTHSLRRARGSLKLYNTLQSALLASVLYKQISEVLQPPHYLIQPQCLATETDLATTAPLRVRTLFMALATYASLILSMERLGLYTDIALGRWPARARQEQRRPRP